MRLLLDSHVAFWWALSPEKLSTKAHTEISKPKNDVFISVVSVWELGLKVSKGKLQIPKEFGELMCKNGIESIPFRESHAYSSIALPRIHGDAFDRALVAQCLLENFTLVTRDSTLTQYGIQILQG